MLRRGQLTKHLQPLIFLTRFFFDLVNIPSSYLEEFQTLMDLKQEPGEDVLTFIGRFHDQESHTFILSISSIPPHDLVAWGLNYASNYIVAKHYEWVASPQQYFTKWMNLEPLRIEKLVETSIAEVMSKYSQEYLGRSPTISHKCPYVPQNQKSLFVRSWNPIVKGIRRISRRYSRQEQSRLIS